MILNNISVIRNVLYDLPKKKKIVNIIYKLNIIKINNYFLTIITINFNFDCRRNFNFIIPLGIIVS